MQTIVTIPGKDYILKPQKIAQDQGKVQFDMFNFDGVKKIKIKNPRQPNSGLKIYF